MSILEVPLEGGEGEVLTIDLDRDLPEDPSEICVLLENEKSATMFWLAIGNAYANKDMIDCAIEVVKKGLGAPIVTSEADKTPFYSCLSWLYLRQLRNSAVTKKPELYETAMEYANKALQLNRKSPQALLARGALALAVHNYDDAIHSFQTVLELSKNTNVYAILGRARVLFHRKQFKGALYAYQQALKLNPKCRPDPRIGIGLCFWKLGDREHAFKAWERALIVDKTSATAAALLGSWYFSEALRDNIARDEFEHRFTAAINYYQQAYRLSNGRNLLACLGLANYLFSCKELSSVEKLANRVLDNASLPEMVAEAYFWKGRVAHSRQDWDEAAQAYDAALTADPDSLAAALGKGLVEMARDSHEAMLVFSTAASKYPTSPDALLLSGISQAQRVAGDPKRVRKAIEALDRYLSLKKTHKESPAVEALQALAQLHIALKSTPPSKALDYAERAIGGFKQADREVQAAMYNNYGVLAYFCNKYEKARGAFTAAQNAPNADEHEITLKFNMARLEDAIGNPEKAREGYDAITQRLPGYVDALARNIYLEIVLGSEEKGGELLSQLLAWQPRNLEIRALMGWYLRRRKWHGARNDDSEQKHYKQTLVEVDKHDTFSLVAMGNLYLMTARETRVTKDSGPERKEKAYFKAAEFFDKALQIDPHNAFAAQGIAIIFAESKQSEQALQIFNRIQETLDDFSVFVNTGHCLMDTKQYAKAIAFYEQAVTRTPHPDYGLYSLISRAWLARGVTEKNVECLTKSLDFSRKALEEHDDNLALRFNVVYIQFQIADIVRRLTPEKRTLADIEFALEGLNAAVESLRCLAKAERPPYAPAELERRAEMGETSLRGQLERAINAQKEFEAEARSKFEEAQRLRMEEQRRTEALERERAARQAELERKLAEERETLLAQTRALEEERAGRRQRELEQERKKPERKRRKLLEDEKFIASDVESSSSGAKSDDEPVAVTGSRNPFEDDAEDADVASPEDHAQKSQGRRGVVEDDDDMDD